MKEQHKQESYADIAALSRKLALLLHAGAGVADGLALLAEEEPRERRKAMLHALAEAMDGGAPLSKALTDTGRYPAYVTGLIAMGEQTGKLEDALNALAAYYERRQRTENRVRRALTYPSVLLVLMLVIIVVLLAKVLPVFDQVYASLGGSLTGLGGALLGAGRQTKEDVIDFAAGVVLKKKTGERVEAGEVLAVLHANRTESVPAAEAAFLGALQWSETAPEKQPLILGIVR